MPISRAHCAWALVLCSLLHSAGAISPASNFDALGQLEVPDLKLDLGKGVERVLSPLILEHRVKVTLHVRLVGFKYDGNHGLVLSEHDLMSYLRTLPSVVNTTVLSLRDHMTLPAEINYFVSAASPSLASELERAIGLAVRAARLPEDAERSVTEASRLRTIPHDIVDAIIQRDLQHTQDNHYTLYILNPKPAPNAYAYSYAGKDTCSGTLWASSRPYVWVDLTAGPVHYGPGPGQHGQVLDHSLPSLRHLNPAQLRAAAMPELAALAQSAVQHLVWPPLQHPQVQRASRVEVHLVHLHKSLMMHGTKVDSQVLQRELRALTLDLTDHITVKEHYLALDQCNVCTAAFTRSIKLRSIRGKGPYLHMVLQEYMDSEELYSWLTRSNEEILAHVQVQQPDNGPHILPVYIFDQGASALPLLLDGDRQAVAFPTMVIASHIIHHTVETDYMCNGEEMYGDETTMTQAVLASLLQAGWGVADTSVAVSAAGNEQHNHLWSVGNDPFTPLAHPSGLSFAQIDAARRNVVLLQLNKTIIEARELMVGLTKLVGRRSIRDVLTKSQKKSLETEAASLFKHLVLATHALGTRQYSKALEHAHAAQSTYESIESVIHEVHYDLASHFQCPHLPMFTGWWVGAVSALLLALLLCVVRTRQEAARSKWY